MSDALLGYSGKEPSISLAIHSPTSNSVSYREKKPYSLDPNIDIDMTLKLNSAARLFRILDQAKSIPDNTQAAEGWVKLLSIQEEHPIRRVIAITALTQGMHHEVQFAVSGLKRLGAL